MKVAIVEALLWVGEPLSVKELTALFDRAEYYLGIVSYHAQCLEDVNVLEVVERRRAEGVGAVETFLYFASREAA